MELLPLDILRHIVFFTRSDTAALAMLNTSRHIASAIRKVKRKRVRNEIDDVCKRNNWETTVWLMELRYVPSFACLQIAYVLGDDYAIRLMERNLGVEYSIESYQQLHLDSIRNMSMSDGKNLMMKSSREKKRKIVPFKGRGI
jgi:hypothetical protein